MKKPRISSRCVSYAKTIGLFLMLAVVCVFGVRAAFYEGYVRMNYPAYRTYPVRGIDVSHHQGSINWQQVRLQGVDFAFIKATEGVTHTDRRFVQNWSAAHQQGIMVGAYHFFSLCRKGREQAKHFIRTVPKLPYALPPALDLEFGGNCQRKNHLANPLQEVQVFIDLVENHYGKKVILYATQEFYDMHLQRAFLGNPIWIRDIYGKPAINRQWLFWQYANRGRIKGIHGFVDLDVFYGSQNEFMSLVKP